MNLYIWSVVGNLKIIVFGNTLKGAREIAFNNSENFPYACKYIQTHKPSKILKGVNYIVVDVPLIYTSKGEEN